MEFFFRHPILRDVARDVHRAAGNEFDAQPIDIHIGVHNRALERRDGRMTIAFQTEHFDTASGTGNYVRINPVRIKANLQACDYIIDFTPHNRPFYETIDFPVEGRVIFGPYIFPLTPPEPNLNPSESALFIGNIPDQTPKHRRATVIESFQKTNQLEVSERRFQHRLDNAIRRHGMVANVHYVDAVYTELPRFIKAFLNGTILISEPLDAPFVAGRHYAPIDAPPPPLPQRLEMLSAIHQDFEPYRLAPLLRRLLAQWRSEGPRQ